MVLGEVASCQDDALLAHIALVGAGGVLIGIKYLGDDGHHATVGVLFQVFGLGAPIDGRDFLNHMLVKVVDQACPLEGSEIGGQREDTAVFLKQALVDGDEVMGGGLEVEQVVGVVVALFKNNF